MSWKDRKCYGEDVLKKSSRRLMKHSRRLGDQEMFAWLYAVKVILVESLNKLMLSYSYTTYYLFFIKLFESNGSLLTSSF